MKKLCILLLFILFTSFQLHAQHHERRERMKAIKTAYLTEKLNLSSQEAEKFWPIYNKYEREIFGYKVQKPRKELKRVQELEASGALDESRAEKSLETLFQYESELALTKKKMFQELQGILSSDRILKLYRAELDFNKKLLSEIRKRGINDRP